jgi:hypothetical protein
MEEGTKTADQGEETKVPEKAKKAEAPKPVGGPPAPAPPPPPVPPTPPAPPAPPEAPPAPPESAPEKPEPPTEIILSAADGSEIHVSQLGLLNLNGEVKAIQNEIAKMEGELKHLREKLGWESSKLQRERGNVLGILSKHNIPDGWRFNRLPDGSYRFTAPAPPPPAPPGQHLPVG